MDEDDDFKPTAPPRRCASCGETVRCAVIEVQALAGFIPVGTVGKYSCARCGATFKVAGIGFSVVLIFASMILVVVASTMRESNPAQPFLLVGALVLFGMGCYGPIARLRFPAVAGAARAAGESVDLEESFLQSNDAVGSTCRGCGKAVQHEAQAFRCMRCDVAVHGACRSAHLVTCSANPRQ